MYDILYELRRHGGSDPAAADTWKWRKAYMLEGILICMAAAVVLCLLISAYDCNRFITVEYEITSDQITKPCRLVLLSDLHNKSYGKDHGRLIGKINDISPDAILTAGDMLTAAQGTPYGKALSLMRQLAAAYPVYYGMGNHEHKLQRCPDQYGPVYDDYVKGLAKSGIVPLVNENVYLPEYNVAVCGSRIDSCYYRKFRKHPMDAAYLPKLLGKPREDACQILIAHTPQYFEEYAEWGADVVVSGHVHGGIMRLPFLGGVLSPNMTLFPKYDGGRFERGKSVMILSRGLGTHTVPVRVFNPAELVVIDLVPGKDGRRAGRTRKQKGQAYHGDSC